jgi:kynurenine formamidase
MPEQDRVAALFADPSAWVDLTYPLNSQTIYWPTADTFVLDTVSAGVAEGGYYYAANNFSSAEHGGTHFDAPIHFAEGGHTSDQVPLWRLIGPAVVVDVADAAARDPDYRVTVTDLETFEAAHGPIPNDAIVLIRTGWGARWPDPIEYLGTELRGPDAVPLLHFPGIDSSAARWLVNERNIGSVGIDTPSIDYGQSASFDAHRILYAENIPAFENVANLHLMPETGAYLIALPMKIEGGSGGPVRMVGLIPPT